MVMTPRIGMLLLFLAGYIGSVVVLHYEHDRSLSARCTGGVLLYVPIDDAEPAGAAHRRLSVARLCRHALVASRFRGPGGAGDR